MFSPENLGAVSDEYEEHFQEDISALENRYQAGGRLIYSKITFDTLLEKLIIVLIRKNLELRRLPLHKV